MASTSTMPYNTRRKSLSLPSLGIHIPVTHAARDAARAAANRAPPNGAGSSSTASRISSKNGSHNHGHRRPSPSSLSQSPSAAASPSASTPTVTFADSPHPNKKMKRSHDESPSGPRKIHQQNPPAQPRQPSMTKLENTPPASPKADRADSAELPDADDVVSAPRPIDLDSINDEIVTAVVVQLQNTGNRPHLVKELTAILMLQLKIVQQSANPCAIISSRLSTFLKRPCWTAQTPCPLAKELETVHPRRTYFYLTTYPHQPLPENGLVSIPMAPPPILQRAIITPSLSSGASGSSEDADEEEECDRRRELSPSPEIDLSSPEFDEFDLDIDDESPAGPSRIGSLSGRPLFGPHHPAQSLHANRHHPYHRGGHHHAHSRNGARGASPPLEKDEKEFTQTANVLQQKRKASGSNLLAAPHLDGSSGSGAPTGATGAYNSRDENLFGGQTHRAFATPSTAHPLTFAMATSPNMRLTIDLGLKRDGEAECWAKLDSMLEWDRSPENIELEEIDCLFTDF